MTDLPVFSARNLPFVIDAIADFPDSPEAGLESLLDISGADAKALFEAAKLLGLVDAAGQPGELASLIRVASVIERREIVRFYVERFETYAYWKRRIEQGFDALEAARQAKAVGGLSQSAAEVRDRFIDLGTYCGSIKESDTTFEATKGSSPSLGSLISTVLNKQQSIQEVLADYVGEPVWAKLPQPVREHLEVSLGKIAENSPPDEAVREAGLAMDKYMEDVGNTLRGGYSGKTMGQSAVQLHADGILRSKHKGYTEYGTKIRNAAEHPDTDADLAGGSWTISARTAVTYLRAVLDFIRSTDAAVGGRHEL